MKDYGRLFEPVRIGPKTMRNRFYQTPHCTSLGVREPFSQAFLRGMKAEGGWAVVNTEYCSIHPESDDSPTVAARLWDDDDMRNLSMVCDHIHEHGALAGVELAYNGAHTTNLEQRLVARGVSQITDTSIWWHSCREMDREEIRELQQFYVDAAMRAERAGFDIVNIQGAEVAAIPLHFLMPYFNKRTDEYGGSFENRARFWRETLELVRAAVGDTCAIAARFCVDTLDDTDLGIRVEEDGVRFIEHVDHLVDFWDIQVGGWGSSFWGEDAMSSRFGGEDFQNRWLSAVRPHTQKPIAGVGRYTNPDTMLALVERGTLDIIGSARPSIADPFLPKKIEEGRLDEIRECIGCNICASRFNQRVRIICTQNATMGEEYRRGWHPERFTRAENADSDVLIVGAGPAGMECAVILGKRGMRRVHLVDAADELGGSLRWIPRLPGLGEWGRVVDYRRIQIDKLRNVDFIPGTLLDAAEVAEYGAEIVVLATGAAWVGDGLNGATNEPIPGADSTLAHIATPEQIMLDGKPVPDGHALVVDNDGYFMGVSLAEKLALEGRRVTLVTHHAEPAPYMRFTLESHSMHRRLAELGITTVTGRVVKGIEPDSVTLGPLLGTAGEETNLQVDAVVLVTQRLSVSGLYRTLRTQVGPDRLAEQGVRGLYQIGDCVAPRLIADAVFDGHRLAREIDSPDPARPLPALRERVVQPAVAARMDSITPSRAVT